MSTKGEESYSDKIQRLALKALDGDYGPLFEAITPFLVHLAIGWNAEQVDPRGDYSIEDWVMIAHTHLYQRLCQYNPARGSFLTWTRIIVKNCWRNEKAKRDSDWQRVQSYYLQGEKSSINKDFEIENETHDADENDEMRELRIKYILKQYQLNRITKEQARDLLERLGLGVFVVLIVAAATINVLI